jgi:hypothetical protein
MFVFISITLLVVTALIMLVLRVMRPGFGYHWLIAVSGAFVAWITLLLAGADLPTSSQLDSDAAPGSRINGRRTGNRARLVQLVKLPGSHCIWDSRSTLRQPVRIPVYLDAF